MRIGTVKLKMRDRVVHTLNEVRYVPDLKKNLISLCALNSKGHKIVIKGGVLKILSGTLVVMKKKKECNLYFLQGCTIISSFLVLTEYEEDSTMLWHMQLGHVGEKAMTVLSN